MSPNKIYFRLHIEKTALNNFKIKPNDRLQYYIQEMNLRQRIECIIYC